MAQRQIKDGATVYMATDERDKDFFKPLKDHYDLVFLDDFHDEALAGINTNYYGMIDQLVATRSRIFYGCWFSTYVLHLLVCTVLRLLRRDYSRPTFSHVFLLPALLVTLIGYGVITPIKENAQVMKKV
jgi:GDP-fucose protein O-fucosyltransferase